MFDPLPREAAPSMGTFTLRFAEVAATPGLTRVAIKDIIDMAGCVTTAGSKVLAAATPPARADAPCLGGIRAAEAAGGAVLVGRTNLHELAFGVTGINPWYGTPVNPLAPERVPGGSSSGSATAVAGGQADVAIGTDTGGSVRIPAACCGIAALKPTNGRISLEGVRPLAPSLDTVGPMGAGVAEVGAGMSLLEPGFEWAGEKPAARIGRFRPPAERWIDDAIDAAIHAAAQSAGFDVVELDLPGWPAATTAFNAILGAEAWAVNAALWTAHAGDLSPDVASRLEAASRIGPEQVEAATHQRWRWVEELQTVWERVDALALPVLNALPPTLEDASRMLDLRLTGPFNLSGGPALALPVGGADPIPASLQLAGPAGSEAMLLATGAVITQPARGRTP